MDGISALQKETQERTQTKYTIYESESRPSPDTKSANSFTLDFLASRIVKNKCLLFVSLPIYFLLLQPKWTKIAHIYSPPLRQPARGLRKESNRHPAPQYQPTRGHREKQNGFFRRSFPSIRVFPFAIICHLMWKVTYITSQTLSILLKYA